MVSSTLFKISAMLALGAGIIFVYKNKQLLLPAGDAARTMTGDASEFVSKAVATLNSSRIVPDELVMLKNGSVKNFLAYMSNPLEVLSESPKTLTVYLHQSERILIDYDSALTQAERELISKWNIYLSNVIEAMEKGDWDYIIGLKQSFTKVDAELSPKTRLEDYAAPNPEEFLPFGMGWDDAEELLLPGVAGAANRLEDSNIIVDIDKALPKSPIKSWMEKAGAQQPTGKKAWGIFDTEAK